MAFHHLRMVIHTPIPCFLRFGKFLVHVSYEGSRGLAVTATAPTTWPRIALTATLLAMLPDPVPSPCFAAFAKSLDKKAIHCNLSWYHAAESLSLTMPLSLRQNPARMLVLLLLIIMLLIPVPRQLMSLLVRPWCLLIRLWTML